MIINSIKIGWKEYIINIVRPSQVLKTESDECYGEINYDELVINIRATDKEEQQEATLIHEVLHGVSEMYGLEMNEETVTRLANALYTVLKDNGLKIEKV